MPESDGPDDDESPVDAGGPIRAEFDWSDVPPSTAVIRTVAIAADRVPTGLESLYGTIDPEALDTLVRSMGTNSTDGDATVRFVFDGYRVTVRRDGTVAVRPDTTRTESV